MRNQRRYRFGIKEFTLSMLETTLERTETQGGAAEVRTASARDGPC